MPGSCSRDWRRWICACSGIARAPEKIAKELQGHPKLSHAHYPTLANFPQVELARKQMKSGGTIVSIDLKGGKEASFRFLNALKLILISNNLGDSKSLATHPATTTHQRLTPEQKAAQGITPGPGAPVDRAGGCERPARRREAGAGRGLATLE